MRSALERLVALVILIIIAPVLFAIAVSVRLASPGPVIFRQQRVGYQGLLFVMYKFRTMYDQPWEAEDFPCGDPRVVPFTSFLRKTHLDELPQLWNIVRGEMAFVGPRPQTPLLAENYARQCRRYQNRFQVLPGITGFAQMQAEKGHFENLLANVAFDEYYRLHRSFWLDLKIALKTIYRMTQGVGR